MRDGKRSVSVYPVYPVFCRRTVGDRRVFELRQLGWSPTFEEGLQSLQDPDLVPARVAAEFRGGYEVWCEQGQLNATIRGRLREKASSRLDLPAVGDWVAVLVEPDGEQAVIEQVLPRKSQFVRQAAGRVTEPQVVAANVDNVFLVSTVTGDFNPRRVERYLTPLFESGATPVIVLNKADLTDSPEDFVAELEQSACGVSIHVVSALEREGVDELDGYCGPGKTVALVGSSGVGKSTIINALIGRDVQAVKEVRASDERGRHATTSRQMLRLPSGGLVIDTPGMRELQLYSGHEGIQQSFADIEELSSSCSFRDCQHENEPGCAVRQAITDAELSPERYQSYLKLQRELAYQVRRTDEAAARAEELKWKRIITDYKKRKRFEGK